MYRIAEALSGFGGMRHNEPNESTNGNYLKLSFPSFIATKV